NTSGSLAFAPMPNANGTATITVTVNDGGAQNNRSTRSCTVTGNPVNDPPTLDPLNPLTMNEDGPAQAINLTGITAGPPNEVQTLVVTASSSNTALIPAPAVSYA